jgi:cysteine desulfurase
MKWVASSVKLVGNPAGIDAMENFDRPIFLDNNSTTPVDPRVFDAMKPYFLSQYGNAASQSHCFGEAAEAAVKRARAQVAAILGACAGEIIWTSGATESNNLAIKGVAYANQSRGRHLITQQTEHSSVIDSFKRLEKDGFKVTWLPVDATGRVSPDDVSAAIESQTVLVSVMWANNETGTIQPIREIASVCQKSNVIFHSDATQAVGKIPINLQDGLVDLLSFSSHKFYGPKGCGGLYVRNRVPRLKIQPLIDGGGHERGYRSGTLNVPAIVGAGAACEIARNEMREDSIRVGGMRTQFETMVLNGLPGVTINGNRDERLRHVTNLSFDGADSESLMLALDDLAVSSGSACTSARVETSHVLRAMGLSEPQARSAIRVSFGRFNRERDAIHAAHRIIESVVSMRQLKPQFVGAKG